ncbi:exported hypothetical protein [Thiocapsa sp. KS1]|nr:DUF945 family protein [Thiocapsa sp. KS1]CRI66459.1 exported hypothetical protein [Thiocapsa sp. KS1]
MRRLLGGAIVAVALLLGLILMLGPFALGHLARIGYDRLVADLMSGSPGATILQNSYRRGWFISSAAFEVLIPADPGSAPPSSPTRIRLDSRIEQGPGLWLASRFPPVFGRVHTRVELQGLPVALPALPVTIDLHLDGSGLVRLNVPPGETVATADVLGLRHSAIDGELRIGSSRRTLAARFGLAELALLSPTGPLARFSDLRFESERPDRTSGTGRLDVAGVELAGVEAAPGAQKGLRIDGLAATLSGNIREGLLDLRLLVSTRASATARDAFGPSQIGLSGERLDMAALEDLAEGLRALGSGQVAQEMQGLVTAGLIAGLVPRFVERAARIAVEPMRIETADGPAVGRLDLRLEPGADTPNWLTSDTGDWLSLLRADGELELPETVALAWLGRSIEEEAGDETLSASSPAFEPVGAQPAAAVQAVPSEARALLEGWISDGWVSRRGDRLASALRLGDGLLTINGKTVPLR